MNITQNEDDQAILAKAKMANEVISLKSQIVIKNNNRYTNNMFGVAIIFVIRYFFSIT